MPRKKICVITPCYREEGNVERCAAAVRDLFAGPLAAYDYEHIFADNASPDRTAELLRGLAATDRRIKVIVNSRNVGPFRNAYNALKSSDADATVLFLAADLQDPAALLVDFVKHWEEGYKIVYGVREKREEPFILKTLRRIYYRVLAGVSYITIPTDTGEFQLIDRMVVDSLKRVDDAYPFLRGLIAQTGLKSIGVKYTWVRRVAGVSNNRLYDLYDQGINGIISTSKLPLRAAVFLGFIMAFVTAAYAVVQLILTLALGRMGAPGIPTLIIGMFFFNSILLFFVGLLGEYILAIHEQLRRGAPMLEIERINFDA
jgi:glycosyltransferase involved in cell wall biosynthesis